MTSHSTDPIAVIGETREEEKEMGSVGLGVAKNSPV